MEEVFVYEPTFEDEISPEFTYLEQLIIHRLDAYFPSGQSAPTPAFPPPATWRLPIGHFVIKNKLSNDEATILLMGLAPHVEPDLFNRMIESKLPEPKKYPIDFPLIGGVRGKNSRLFLPTGETVLFLLGDDMIEKRLQLQQLFGAEHIFWEKKITWLEDLQDSEPTMHGRLIMSPDYIDLFLYGIHKSPQFSISFPAKKIAPLKVANPPGFDQLILSDELFEQIEELKSWLKYHRKLMRNFGMQHKLKKGYRTLFYGPPGTGKTFTAQILGNDVNLEVYKIDLSMVVSKYIGETEKNLELLFARAEDKGWILFFDEADALFGKRSNVRDAHDKYANQEVSYLLQRIEDYNGLVILATNMKNNIDDAFIRRFNSVLKFPFPDARQRSMIWNKIISPNIICKEKLGGAADEEAIEVDVNLGEAVKKYELSGGNIVNVVQYAAIKGVEALNKKRSALALSENGAEALDEIYDFSDDEEGAGEGLTRSPLVIYLNDVIDGIKREMIKEGKPF